MNRKWSWLGRTLRRSTEGIGSDLSVAYAPKWSEKDSAQIRLPFGLKVSSDIFQERLNSILQEGKGIMTCVDDLLGRGVDCKDHHVNMLRLLLLDSNDECHKVQYKETAVQEHQMRILWTHSDAGK